MPDMRNSRSRYITECEPGYLELLGMANPGWCSARSVASTRSGFVHKLTPNYEKQLEGDFIQQIQHNYDKMFAPLIHKSFDDILDKLGDLGAEVRKLEAARQLLANKEITDDRLPELLYQQNGEGGAILRAAGGAKPSPWAEILPGVIARYTIIGGYMSNNLLEFRVTTSAAPANPTLAQILGMDETQWPHGPVNLIGYPIGHGAQIPIITPILTDSVALRVIMQPENASKIVPTITSFTSTSQGIGALVTITGNDFTDANAVKFNDTPAYSFKVVNSTTVTAMVDVGTKSGQSVSAHLTVKP